jgi:hypothetical protein
MIYVIHKLRFDDRDSVFVTEEGITQGTSKCKSPKEPTDSSQCEIP